MTSLQTHYKFLFLYFSLITSYLAIFLNVSVNMLLVYFIEHPLVSHLYFHFRCLMQRTSLDFIFYYYFMFWQAIFCYWVTSSLFSLVYGLGECSAMEFMQVHFDSYMEELCIFIYSDKRFLSHTCMRRNSFTRIQDTL